MDYKELIAQTATMLGMEGLEPDDDGVVEIISEDADIVILDCPDAGNALVMTAKIMDAPKDEQGVYLAALRANHRFAATKGASISLDSEDGSLNLAIYRPLAVLDAEKMVALIEDFAATLFSLRKTLSE